MWNPLSCTTLQSHTRLLCTTSLSLSQQRSSQAVSRHWCCSPNKPPFRTLTSLNCVNLTRSSLLSLAGTLRSVVGGVGVHLMSTAVSMSVTHSTAAAASVSESPSSDSSDSEASSSNHSQAAGEYALVNFYHLNDLLHAFKVVKQHREFVGGMDLKGRIYISRQGINAQFSGLMDQALEYVRWVSVQPEFEGLRYIVDPVDSHQFPKLRLKYKESLVQLAGGTLGLPLTDPQCRATPLDPLQWQRMLREARRVEGDGKVQQKAVVLDVRNGYEWDAGHFEGAQRPKEDNFNETPTEGSGAGVPDYLQGVAPDTPVMMYCTGGIRCDIYSTYLRKKGFTNLFTLEGGVHKYFKETEGEGWKGSLFVFDGRMAVSPGHDCAAGIGSTEDGSSSSLPAAVSCQSCGSPALLPHMNCANVDCNKLFVACDTCKTQFDGCCCSACMNAPRLLRPAKTAGLYGTWLQYATQQQDKLVMSVGRGSGRTSRRRVRQMALKERQQSKRMEKVERRRKAKATMLELQQSKHDSESSESSASDCELWHD